VVEVSEELIAGLKKKAVTLRKHIIRMTHNAQSGHPGGSMSACDIVTALYFHVLRVDPTNPTWPDRDRFVLSKGHACPGDALARLVVIAIVIVLLFGNAFRLLRRPRRERSP